MGTVLGIALVVMVGVWALSWIVGRFNERRGSHLSLTVGIAMRFVVVIALVEPILYSVNRGGWFVALAVLFGLIAAFSALMGVVLAVALWMSLTGSNDTLGEREPPE